MTDTSKNFFTHKTDILEKLVFQHLSFVDCRFPGSNSLEGEV